MENKEATPIKFCLYARKSTEQEDKQMLSIDSQIKEMEKMALGDGLEFDPAVADPRK